MALKRAIAGTLLLCGLVAGIYFMYFNHGSPEDILAANRRSSGNKSHNDVQGKLSRKALHVNDVDGDEIDDDYEEEDIDDDKDIIKSSRRRWDNWVDKNNFVSIGEIFNKCDEDGRVMMGRVVLVEDKVHGGVAAVTYVNTTWDHVIDDGEVLIDVQYNGKNLYNNKWELCTIDENEEERIVVCPFKKQEKHYKKEMKIPNYLPKGNYKAKVWMTDQNDNDVACGFADFTL